MTILIHYLSQLFPWRPNPSGKVLKTVRENFFWQVPSGMARQGWTDRESPPSLTENRHGMVPDGYCRQERVFPSTFFVSVRREFSRWLPYRQERFKLTLSVTVPSGKVETYPAGHLPSGKDQTFCQPTTIREITILISIKAHSTIQIID